MAEFICPPDHRHAEVGTCYCIHKCRCAPCREFNVNRERARNRAKLYGRYDTGLVDAAPVRAHVEMLQEFGLGWQRIAALSGVGNTAVESLIYGRKGSSKDPRRGEVQKRVSREKAEKLLAVKPEFDSLADGARISSRGVRRRVQALITRGWSQSKLATMLGRDVTNFGLIFSAEQVTVGYHRDVAALYEKLCMVSPPQDTRYQRGAATLARRYAAARRWVPPLAWDDIDTDPEPPVADDDGTVDETAIELALSGERVRLTPAERRVAVPRLHAERWSDGRIAETLSVDARTVLRIRQELGLEAFDQTELRQRGAA